MSADALPRKKSRNLAVTQAVLDMDNAEVHGKKEGVGGNSPSKNSDYLYVNRAYAGNLSSLSDIKTISDDPPTSTSAVIREQYWACTKWPRAQRLLVITVGVLVGAVLGLTITMSIVMPHEDPLTSLLRKQTAPD